MNTIRAAVDGGLPLEVDDGADRLWHLRRTGITEALSMQQVRHLSSRCRDTLFTEDALIYSPFDPADALYLINRGAVRLTSINFEGREKVLGVLGPGSFFGEEALEGADAVRPVRAVAHEECWVYRIEAPAIQEMMLTMPQLSINLLRLLSGRLSEARQELETLSFHSTEERVAKVLIRLCRDHGSRLASREDVQRVRIPVSHELLAQMIGANRPHVSAIMSGFRKKGWVDYRRRKLLVNVRELRHAYCEEAAADPES